MTVRQWKNVQKLPEYKEAIKKAYSRGYSTCERKHFKNSRYPHSVKPVESKGFLYKLLSW